MKINIFSLFQVLPLMLLFASPYPLFSIGRECSDATPLMINHSCNPVTYRIGNGFSVSSPLLTCGGNHQDGWFSFTGNGGTVHLGVTNIEKSMSVEVFSGTCGSLTSYQCQMTGEPSNGAYIQVPTDFGSSYYVKIARAVLESGKMDGHICAFSTDGSAPPTHDECSGAIPLEQSITPSPISSSVAGATQSQAACSGNANNDVWFSFVARTVSPRIVVVSEFDAVLELLEGCSGTSLACNDTDKEIQSTGLTVGSTYFIRVHSYLSGTPANSAFAIAVWDGFVPGNSCYIAESIPYEPEDWNTGTDIPFTDDDEYFNATFPIGFDFNFMSNTVSSFVVSSNGIMSFDLSYAGEYSHFSPRPIPFSATGGGLRMRNAIFGAWYDLQPSAGGNIRYHLSGTAPNRVLTLKYVNVPHYSCSNDLISQQIQLHESNGFIDIHLENHVECPGWQEGRATVGIHNADGTQATTLPGRNNLVWSGQESWRFRPCILNERPLNLVLDCGAGRRVDLDFPEMDHVHQVVLKTMDGSGLVLEVDTFAQASVYVNAQLGTIFDLPAGNFYEVDLYDEGFFKMASGSVLSDCGPRQELNTWYKEGFLYFQDDFSEAQPYQALLFGMNGQMVKSWDLDGLSGFSDGKLETGGLVSGVYFLQIRSMEGARVARIFIQ